MSVYTPITGNPSYKLVFDDEFNGTSLDTSKWLPPVTEHDNTYPNTNKTEMMASNVSVNDGVLDLKVTPGPTPNGSQYGTASITSQGTTIPGEPINVYWEARIKNMDNANGLVSAFWTDTAHSWTFPEVDFNEYWQSYTADATGQHYNDGNTFVLPGEGASTGSDLAAGYHVYGALWTPTSIKFYIDGVLTAETATDTDKTSPEWYAILNATAGGGGIWPNGTAQIPNNMYVDYVHVYSAQPGAVAVTPEAGYGGPGDTDPTVRTAPITSAGGTASSNGLAAPSDFNGDGHSDILWQNTNGQAAIWELNGTNILSGTIVGSNPGPSWKAIGTGDFNDNGHSDILWQNTNGQAAIWEMNGTNEIGGGNVGANPGPSWKAIGTGDFNDDGHSDILWQNTNGQAEIWEMNGTKVIGEAAVGANPGPSWKAIGTGDFNDDGHSDILWQNTNGQAAIWEMNGTKVISGVDVVANPGPSWKAIGTGDFNDDGHSDILWQNTNGQAEIWEMNGTKVIGEAAVGANPGPSWKAIGTGDFNDDGHSDILWQNTNGQAAIWEMNGINVIGEANVGANPGPSWLAKA